jgi:hypothetical protein
VLTKAAIPYGGEDGDGLFTRAILFLLVVFLGSLKDSSRQPLEISPGLWSFVIFVFHLYSLSPGKVGLLDHAAE